MNTSSGLSVIIPCDISLAFQCDLESNTNIHVYFDLNNEHRDFFKFQYYL